MISMFCHSIGPYHAARYKALSSITKDFSIIELLPQWQGYHWTNMAEETGARVSSLFSDSIQNYSINQQIHIIENELSTLKSNVVVTVGYSELVMRVASIWANKHNALSIMMTDSWKGDKKRFAPLELVKGFWCKIQYDAIFISGTLSYKYFSGLGFPSNRIWKGVDVVDNDYFIQQTNIIRNESDLKRQSLKLPKYFFLCCARLAPEKNIERLIYAFKQYRDNDGGWDLVIIGSGPLEKSLKILSEEIVPIHIHFKGWIQYSDLPTYYALSSCLILPSISEPWGLVVNEAMASSLPILVSRKCGCIPELCSQGVNGWDFDPFDINSISQSMLAISSMSEEKRHLFGQASLSIINNFSPITWANSLLDCINTSITSKSKNAKK